MTFIDFYNNEKEKDYFKKLFDFVDSEYQTKTIYPLRKDIFRAFSLTDFDNVKVVILGQDPYHEEGEAHGLAFSTLNKKLPPSLKNIYKEMESDLNVKINQDGNLDYLAKQGVLLLNTVLTVEEGKAFSHKNKGWEIFTDNVIKELNKDNKPKVFILWGNPSISKETFITNPNHLVIKSIHPSPLSANRPSPSSPIDGFFGSKPFSRTNEFLIKNKLEPINWIKND